ncbi:hypothetical protein [Streptomyces xanthophaeus]|uniref:hypothetical protein n=1 Tax=Streptomyces xanthophaeus TaxID=67385 RepID=UPI00233F3C2E|nr:hypothetical protein [Streptomyces xanthophaeus]
MKKIRIVTAMVLATIAFGAVPAHAVDPRQEHNISKCYFDKHEADKQKYCKALEGRPMTKAAKDCLIRAGVGSAAALIVGRVNKKVAREIAVNTVAAGATGCITALLG